VVRVPPQDFRCERAGQIRKLARFATPGQNTSSAGRDRCGLTHAVPDLKRLAHYARTRLALSVQPIYIRPRRDTLFALSVGDRS